MKSINDLSDEITIIIVAHRLSTLKSCNKIIELHDGEVSSIGTYDELIKNV
jgi:ATP-binding cassette subfamily B protein